MGLWDSFKSVLGSGRVDLKKRFVFLQKLPTGTMSNVFRVKDRSTGQILALKILDQKLVDEFESRFEKSKKPSEGEISTSLNHPNIVQTLEHGMNSEGQGFLIMEFIQGVNLSEAIVSHQQLLNGNRLALIKQMAEAIAAVHQAGYLHRDLCPHNFILQPDGTSLKMIDFGLSLPAHPDFMKPGNRTGKADYMAPELIRRQPTDHRVDVFAFGVTAYELCVGKLPWASGTAQQAIQRSAYQPPSIKESCSWACNELASLIAQAVQPDPEQRFQSMDQVLEAIEELPTECAA